MLRVSKLEAAMTENDELKLRLLYLEQELNNMSEHVRRLEERLENNPFTRDSFRINYEYYRKYSS